MKNLQKLVKKRIAFERVQHDVIADVYLQYFGDEDKSPAAESIRAKLAEIQQTLNRLRTLSEELNWLLTGKEPIPF